MSDDSERLALLALWLTPGLGPHRVRALRARYGSARHALDAILSDGSGGAARATVPGVPRIVADAAAGAREATRAARVGATLLTDHDHAFPAHWGVFPDLPPLLYVRGVWPQQLTPWPPAAIAVIGSRRADAAACAFAFDLAAAAARARVTVVSGLAYGIDAAAHRGALSAGAGAGATVAVVASGVDRPGPAGNLALARSILTSGGALIAEAPLGSSPSKGDFPRRNRLIAALSRAVVVVAAGTASGAHRTAGHAAAYGRDVFVVPARPWDETYAGNLALLRDGASPVYGVEDALQALGIRTSPGSTDAPDDPAATVPSGLRWLWTLLSATPEPVEALVERGGRGVGATLAGLETLVAAQLCSVDGARRYRRR